MEEVKISLERYNKYRKMEEEINKCGVFCHRDKKTGFLTYRAMSGEYLDEYLKKNKGVIAEVNKLRDHIKDISERLEKAEKEKIRIEEEQKEPPEEEQKEPPEEEQKEPPEEEQKEPPIVKVLRKKVWEQTALREKYRRANKLLILGLVITSIISIILIIKLWI